MNYICGSVHYLTFSSYFVNSSVGMNFILRIACLCCEMMKLLLSIHRAHLRVIAPGQHSFFRRNVSAMASRLQHCVQFDRLEIWTSDLPLQIRALPLDQFWFWFDFYRIITEIDEAVYKRNKNTSKGSITTQFKTGLFCKHLFIRGKGSNKQFPTRLKKL